MQPTNLRPVLHVQRLPINVRRVQIQVPTPGTFSRAADRTDPGFPLNDLRMWHRRGIPRRNPSHPARPDCRDVARTPRYGAGRQTRYPRSRPALVAQGIEQRFPNPPVFLLPQVTRLRFLFDVRPVAGDAASPWHPWTATVRPPGRRPHRRTDQATVGPRRTDQRMPMSRINRGAAQGQRHSFGTPQAGRAARDSKRELTGQNLNDGGPSAGHMLLWRAWGVGKSGRTASSGE
jgi:hypothetical protein